MTYLSLAQYNAIIAAEDSKTPGTHPSRAGAAAGASVVVLKYLFPNTPAIDYWTRIDEHLAAQKAGPVWPGEKHQDFAAGEAIGRAIGVAVVKYAQDDNFDTATRPTSGPGGWIGTTPARGLFGTRPFTLTPGNHFLPDAPPAYLSPKFVADLAEVQALSASHTDEQVGLAVFWNLRVARYQNELATDMIVSHRRSERDAAHILALANIAGFDALIACWEAKFTYWYIRPWQVDASIRTPIGQPNHPSYPSGHSCVTAAYSEVLGRTFPQERPGLEANVVAAGQSRINAGIHYRFDILAGQGLGRRVADHVLATDVSGHQPIPLD